MRQFGLIGKSLSHSKSPELFKHFFIENNLHNAVYQLFELNEIEDIKELLYKNPDLEGINVTIPYKTSIIPFLDEIDEDAEKIGAVNCVKIISSNSNSLKMKGFNTDVIGFQSSISNYLKNTEKNALIFGSGGAAKAAYNAFLKMNIQAKFVSRNPKSENQIGYNSLSDNILQNADILVNATPVGMFPKVDESLNINYNCLSDKHLAFDMIYNPLETLFLKKCKEKGCTTVNGIEMLHVQAIAAWDIWNNIKNQ